MWRCEVTSHRIPLSDLASLYLTSHPSIYQIDLASLYLKRLATTGARRGGGSVGGAQWIVHGRTIEGLYRHLHICARMTCVN